MNPSRTHGRQASLPGNDWLPLQLEYSWSPIMVRAIERPATLALPDDEAGVGAALEALYVRADEAGAGGAVIAPPHPLMGGSFESPVVAEIAHACEAAGRATLRFNWRGVGASAGERSEDAAVADVDYAAALSFLSDSGDEPIVACGYSFGALTALRATDRFQRSRRMILVAPPPSMLDRELLLAYPNEIFIACGDSDPYVDVAELSTLTREARAVHLEVIPDCDHFFMSGLGRIGQAIADWWKRDD
jgi:hypothetical protein